MSLRQLYIYIHGNQQEYLDLIIINNVYFGLLCTLLFNSVAEMGPGRPARDKKFLCSVEIVVEHGTLGAQGEPSKRKKRC